MSLPVLHDNPEPAKRTLVSETWRALRTRGWAYVLGRLRFQRAAAILGRLPHVCVLRFVDLVAEETLWRYSSAAQADKLSPS